MVLGVGGGIGFDFRGVTCGGGVVGLEEPGLLVLVAFWSFANRFSRIFPSLVNVLQGIRRGFTYPVGIVLGGWTQLIRIRIGAHGCRRDYRHAVSRGERDPRASTTLPSRTQASQHIHNSMLFSSTSATSLLNAVAGFRSGPRSFATSSALWYPKLKSHSGTKKRWRSLPNGLFKRVSFRLRPLILLLILWVLDANVRRERQVTVI